MSFGVMGADMQPQGQTQIIVNRVDYGLDIQAAGDSPRWHHQGSPQTMGEDEPGLGPEWRPQAGVRRAGGDAAPAAAERLDDRRVRMADSGRYQCIELRGAGASRVYAAASEMRADGIALAY